LSSQAGLIASRVLSVFSKVWFWFLVVFVGYLVLAGHDFFNLRLTHEDWWNKFYAISSAFLVGGLVSFLFYFLVVFVPEWKKRRVIKSNLKAVYADIKRDILLQIIFASRKGGRTDLSADSETVNRLLTIDGFKSAFQKGREADEGFYAFQNYMSDDVPEYREILLSLHVLSRQIDFVLHNYPILDSRIFSFFKRLEMLLVRLEKLGPGYEEEKQLSKFIWEIFAGFNIIKGNVGYDIIEKMIDDI
jgi:hypothetical protein